MALVIFLGFLVCVGHWVTIFISIIFRYGNDCFHCYEIFKFVSWQILCDFPQSFQVKEVVYFFHSCE
jgi:hypothetical protein